MTTAEFLERFRGLGGDAYRTGAAITLVGSAELLAAIQWRVFAVGKPAFLEALEREEQEARERIALRRRDPRFRGRAPTIDE